MPGGAGRNVKGQLKLLQASPGGSAVVAAGSVGESVCAVCDVFCAGAEPAAVQHCFNSVLAMEAAFATCTRPDGHWTIKQVGSQQSWLICLGSDWTLYVVPSDAGMYVGGHTWELQAPVQHS